MSNPEQVAFENLQRLAVMFRGIIDIAPELQKISSLKGAQDEARIRLDQIKSEATKGEEDARRVEGAARATSDRIILDARTLADSIKRDANKVLDEAKQDAKSLRDEAQTLIDANKSNAEKALSVAREKLAALQAEHADWISKIKSVTDDHAVLARSIADKEGEHQKVKAAIDEVLARLGR
jgi:transcriptional accessory protein Tex/SPT6